VPKCVFKFLEGLIFKDFQAQLEQKSLIELELASLLELFKLKYSPAPAEAGGDEQTTEDKASF
jgi:hypothetical protein